MTEARTLLSILIASLGRPSLLRTLASIAAATRPDDLDIEIVIADDSKTDAVAALLATHSTPLAIRIVPVGAGNVAIARNATLEAARGDWLLLVDDDEYVDRDWLVQHLATAREFAADAVFGPVYPVYPETTPAWFRKANPMFHDLDWADHGRRIFHGQSGNTLIRAAAIRASGLRFDPAYGRTGGEDHEFFRRMAAAGATLIVTDRAKAWEDVPPERTTIGYTLSRMARTGALYARIVTRDASPAQRLAFAANAAAKLAITAAATVVLWPIDRGRSFRMRMRVSSNIGKLQSLFGWQPGHAWKLGG